MWSPRVLSGADTGLFHTRTCPSKGFFSGFPLSLNDTASVLSLSHLHKSPISFIFYVCLFSILIPQLQAVIRMRLLGVPSLAQSFFVSVSITFCASYHYLLFLWKWLSSHQFLFAPVISADLSATQCLYKYDLDSASAMGWCYLYSYPTNLLLPLSTYWHALLLPISTHLRFFPSLILSKPSISTSISLSIKP